MGLVDAIPQTIKEIGRDRAIGRASSGAYGQSLADIGQMVSTIPAQIQAKKIQDQQMQVRAQELESGSLDLAAKKRAAAADAALGSAFSTSLNPDGTVNIPALTQHLASTPAASSIPKIVESLNAMQESGVKLQTSRVDLDQKSNDALGLLAHAAESAGDDPNDQAGVLLAGVASRVKRGQMSQDDAHQIITGVLGDDNNPDPAKVKSTIARLKAQSKEERTLEDTDTRAKYQAESASALAAERKATMEAKQLRDKLSNISSQLSKTTSQAQYARVYRGIPDDVKAYFDSPDEWTKDSATRATDVLLTPEQREMKRRNAVDEADKSATRAENERYHRDSVNARREATTAREKATKAASNAENVRAYNEFTQNWDRQYPKPAAGAVDDNGDHLPAPPAPPSLDKWSVMTPLERQKVLREPNARIDDAEMQRRMGGPATPASATPPAATPQTAKPGAGKMIGTAKLKEIAKQFGMSEEDARAQAIAEGYAVVK